jgi:hypothetical protein
MATPDRQYVSYNNSDWMKVTVVNRFVKYGILFCNHYWYNPKHKIMLTTPMERMFYLMIGRFGYQASDQFAQECRTKDSDFIESTRGWTKVRKVQ